MKPCSVGRFLRCLLMVSIFFSAVPISLSQPFAARSAGNVAVSTSRPLREQQRRALAGLGLCCGSGIDYIGLYSSDGKFRTTTRVDREYLRSENLRSVSTDAWSRPSEVPSFIDLHPRERVEPNYEPPAHAVNPVKGHSLLAMLRDNLVTLAYGRERLFLGPHHITVDSRGRILIVDPDIHAVHVLGGDKPFRIEGGPQRRLRMPNGIAVDADDNIYIVDAERGLVLVYDPDGRFLRYIGKRGDESLFHYPTAIAIDRGSGRLFVLDTPRHLLFVLDLEGNVLERIGRARPHAIGKVSGETVLMDLDYPTEMVLGNNELVVVDSSNSRINVIDLQGNLVVQFRIPGIPGPPVIDDVGLGVDRAGNIYISTVCDSHVRIFGRDGSLLGSFGRTGAEIGEFNSPAGLWIDEKNRLYVADTNNGRVQVFQVSRDFGVDRNQGVGATE